MGEGGGGGGGGGESEGGETSNTITVLEPGALDYASPL